MIFGRANMALLDKQPTLYVNSVQMSADYRRNKIRTLFEIMRRIENWPMAAGMRLRKQHKGLRLLNFRDGINVVYRAGCGDWEVLHELFFAGGYGSALDTLRHSAAPPVVLDLGGNIGAFALLAASRFPSATIHSFEPGPPNQSVFEMNQLANPGLSHRIILHKVAVGGNNAILQWYFDESNPGGSSLYGAEGSSFSVTVRSFADIVREFKAPIALVKIDIEGGEYDLLRDTPTEIWSSIAVIALELHDDPTGQMPQQQFLDRFRALGFTVEEPDVCTYLLRR